MEIKERDIHVGDLVGVDYSDSLYKVYKIEDDQVKTYDKDGYFWIDLATVESVWVKKIMNLKGEVLMLAFYGKKKTDKTFKMYNIKNDTFVDRKIHVTVFDEKERDELEKDIEYMNKHNPDYVFELRKI